MDLNTHREPYTAHGVAPFSMRTRIFLTPYLLWVCVEQALDGIRAHSCLTTGGATQQLQALSSCSGTQHETAHSHNSRQQSQHEATGWGVRLAVLHTHAMVCSGWQLARLCLPAMPLYDWLQECMVNGQAVCRLLDEAIRMYMHVHVHTRCMPHENYTIEQTDNCRRHLHTCAWGPQRQVAHSPVPPLTAWCTSQQQRSLGQHLHLQASRAHT